MASGSLDSVALLSREHRLGSVEVDHVCGSPLSGIRFCNTAEQELLKSVRDRTATSQSATRVFRWMCGDVDEDLLGAQALTHDRPFCCRVRVAGTRSSSARVCDATHKSVTQEGNFDAEKVGRPSDPLLKIRAPKKSPRREPRRLCGGGCGVTKESHATGLCVSYIGLWTC